MLSPLEETVNLNQQWDVKKHPVFFILYNKIIIGIFIYYKQYINFPIKEEYVENSLDIFRLMDNIV
jgi:hypothetical protein